MPTPLHLDHLKRLIKHEPEHTWRLRRLTMIQGVCFVSFHNRKLNQERLRKLNKGLFIGGDISAFADTSAIDVVTAPAQLTCYPHSVISVVGEKIETEPKIRK